MQCLLQLSWAFCLQSDRYVIWKEKTCPAENQRLFRAVLNSFLYNRHARGIVSSDFGMCSSDKYIYKERKRGFFS